MNIDIVTTDSKHPLVAPVRHWARVQRGHRVRLLKKLSAARSGDALVMIACHEIARPAIRSRYRRTYVTHASDLPKGRGWSPVVWRVLEGKSNLVVSLIEAADPVDSGRLYAKFRAPLPKTALWPEINEVLAKLIVRCLDHVVRHHLLQVAANPQHQRCIVGHLRPAADQQVEQEQAGKRQQDCCPNQREHDTNPTAERHVRLLVKERRLF